METQHRTGRYFGYWLKLAVFSAASAFASLSAQAQQVSVSDSGTPTYSYPIAVPPGIGDMSPNLGLLYTGGINGPVGYGWTVQGISMIARCPNTKAIDGVIRGVGYNKDDKLCLDGQRLIQTDANGVPVNWVNSNPDINNPFQTDDSLGGTGMVHEYRTEKDIYARIRAYGMAGTDANNGPAYFKVWTKSGQIYEYGVNSNATANAQITAQGKTVVAVWPVSRISDTVGNYMDFQYEQRDEAWGSNSSLGHEWNLQEVRYTGNGAQAPTNKVVFTYENRPATPAAGSGNDRSEAYHLGSKNVSIRRLIKVQTLVNASPGPLVVKTLQLAYDNGPITNRSRLVKITECNGNETKCLPPTTFNYAPGGDVSYTASAVFSASSLATMVLQNMSGSYGLLTGDFNGDGKADFIRWADNPIENRLYFSNGDGGFTQAANFNVTTQNFSKSDQCYTSMLADFNADGLPDILRYAAAQSPNGTACATPGANYLFLNNGNGTFASPLPITSGGQPLALKRVTSTDQTNCTTACGNVTYSWTQGWNFYLLDINGDGKVDLITAEMPGTVSNRVSACTNNVCTHVYIGNGLGNFTETPTNLATKIVFDNPPIATAIKVNGRIADIDGDGLSDLVAMWNGAPGYFGSPSGDSSTNAWRSRGDGNFEQLSTASRCANPMDFNGDGRADCLAAGTTASANQLILMTGDGSQPVTGFNLVNAGQELSGKNVGLIVADMDGDGRNDILRWKGDPSQNAVYLSNGDGTFRNATSFNLTNTEWTNGLANTDQLQAEDGSYSSVLGDFRGYGNIEILRLVSNPASRGTPASNKLYVKSNTAPADQLLSVVSSTGLKTTLTWVPLSNPSSGSLGARYATDRGTANAAVYPKADYIAPMYVVATTAADSGVGSGKVITEYSYAGLKAGYDGRGSLGFRQKRRQSPTPDGGTMTVSTESLQDAPYTGVAAISQSWLGALNASTPSLLSRTTNIYCDKNAATSPESATSKAPCLLPATAKIRRPYLYRSIEEGWDPSGGTALPVVTTTNSFNNSGDVTQIVVGTSGTALGLQQDFTKTTTNIYLPDNTSGDKWILGRLQRATVNSQAPNSLDNIATSAGTAPGASAVTGTAPARTLIPAPDSLSAILTILLLDD